MANDIPHEPYALIVGYLQDAVDHLIKARLAEATKEDRGVTLLEGDKHALRILQAAIRRNGHLGTLSNPHAEPRERTRAALALQLNDNGDVFKYAGVTHSRGRLDCSGCDFIYLLLKKEPQCVLCRFCKKGVEHVRTVHGPFAQEDEFGTVRVNDGEAIRWTQCDACGSRSVAPIQLEEESVEANSDTVGAG